MGIIAVIIAVFIVIGLSYSGIVTFLTIAMPQIFELIQNALRLLGLA